MAIAAFSRTLAGYGEPAIGQSFGKSFIVVFPPYGKGSARFEGCSGAFDGLAAVQRIICFVGMGMGAVVQIEDDGIEGLFLGFRCVSLLLMQSIENCLGILGRYSQ